MKLKTKQEPLRFPLSLLHCGNSYYIERMAALEKALARKPRLLQIDLLGEGDLGADWALMMRSLLNQRAARTQVITNARSSLQNSTVLVWLLGDRRLIRDDARIFLRRANISEDDNTAPEKVWFEDDLKYVDSYSEIDPEEADYAKVLQLINGFLPVKELVGRVIDVPALRQFGLVGNDRFDNFLAAAFRPSQPRIEALANESNRWATKPSRRSRPKRSSKTTRAGVEASARNPFHIPLADQLRRRSAKPRT
jgi:hypothetical protein